MVSQNDVAKRAGVSNAVVSYVVNNGPRKTSEETRKKVLKAIEELGYRKNNVARSLKTNTSKVIGLIIPDSSNEFYSEVAKGIEEELYKWGYTLMFGNSANSIERQRNYIETFISQMADGIIFLTTPLPQDHLGVIKGNKIPMVVVDPEFDINKDREKELCIVTVDNHKGGRLAGEYLLAQGHQKLAVITGAEKVPPATDRVEGFQSVLQEVGIDAEILWHGDHPEDGYQAAKQLLTSSDSPTAIFACNDLLALGVLRAAEDLNIRVPEDLAIIGFDDIEIADFICPRLTTIRQPKYEVGQVSAEFLIKLIQQNIDGKCDEGKGGSQSIMLDTELIIRESA